MDRHPNSGILFCMRFQYYIPGKGFKPYSIILFYSNGYVARFTGIYIAYPTRFTDMRSFNYNAVVAIF